MEMKLVAAVGRSGGPRSRKGTPFIRSDVLRKRNFKKRRNAGDRESLARDLSGDAAVHATAFGRPPPTWGVGLDGASDVQVEG